MSNRPIQLVGLLALVMLTGCYSYNPYGYGGYPRCSRRYPLRQSLRPEHRFRASRSLLV